VNDLEHLEQPCGFMGFFFGSSAELGIEMGRGRGSGGWCTDSLISYI